MSLADFVTRTLLGLLGVMLAIAGAYILIVIFTDRTPL